MSEAENTNQTESLNQIMIKSQYIRDLSFECPNSPVTFEIKEVPTLNLNLEVSVKQLAEDAFEVTLHIASEIKADDKVCLIVDLIYAGIFIVPAMETQQLNFVLYVTCPQMLFPFARRIIADITSESEFQAVVLNPVDFQQLYLQKLAQAQTQS